MFGLKIKPDFLALVLVITFAIVASGRISFEKQKPFDTPPILNQTLITSTPGKDKATLQAVDMKITTVFAPQTSGSACSTDDDTCMQHYIDNFGFDPPRSPLPTIDTTTLSNMACIAINASTQFNSAYGIHVEPELILWWADIEGAAGHTGFSNCNSSVTYTNPTNCATPDNWQLGEFGSQFSGINQPPSPKSLLETASNFMYGTTDLNSLNNNGVIKNVLSKNPPTTEPLCNKGLGSNCVFPNTYANISELLLNGVDTTKQTDNNWWASILVRDPSINAFIEADALQKGFTKAGWWSKSYGQEPKLQSISNEMAAILQNWSSIISSCPTP